MTLRSALSLMLAVLIGVTLAADPAAAQQKWTLKYGHVGPATDVSDDHIPGLWLKSFLEGRSNGRIKVEIYPASQLGDFRALIEGVQLNTVELAHTSVGGVGQFFPELQVVELPYAIPDDLVAEKLGRHRFFDDIRDAVLKKTGNVRLMAASNTGRFRSFFTTKKPIKSATDLKGIKMRTIDSPMEMEFVRFFGGNPTPVVWGELYTSLATGVVEGTKNAATDIVPNNMHDSLKHVVLDEHAYLWGFYWMSDKWLKSLPRDLQSLVIDGVVQMADMQTNWNKQYENKSLEMFAKAGGKVYVPTADERATFLKGRDHMRQWWVQKYGKEWLDRLEKAVAQVQADIEKDRQRIGAGSGAKK